MHTDSQHVNTQRHAEPLPNGSQSNDAQRQAEQQLPDGTLSAGQQPQAEADRQSWYALWVYRGLSAPVAAICTRDGVTTYQPMRTVEAFTAEGKVYRQEPLITNLLFVRATASYVDGLRRQTQNRAIPYCHPGTRDAAAIDDRTMEIFMLTVRAGADRMEAVDFPIDKGDRVRVREGIFKGAEGYIRRVHGTRRLVVAIEGVVAVAVTHIPRQFLEPA